MENLQRMFYALLKKDVMSFIRELLDKVEPKDLKDDLELRAAMVREAHVDQEAFRVQMAPQDRLVPRVIVVALVDQEDLVLMEQRVIRYGIFNDCYKQRGELLGLLR